MSDPIGKVFTARPGAPELIYQYGTGICVAACDEEPMLQLRFEFLNKPPVTLWVNSGYMMELPPLPRKKQNPPSPRFKVGDKVKYWGEMYFVRRLFDGTQPQLYEIEGATEPKRYYACEANIEPWPEVPTAEDWENLYFAASDYCEHRDGWRTMLYGAYITIRNKKAAALK